MLFLVSEYQAIHKQESCSLSSYGCCSVQSVPPSVIFLRKQIFKFSLISLSKMTAVLCGAEKVKTFNSYFVLSETHYLSNTAFTLSRLNYPYSQILTQKKTLKKKQRKSEDIKMPMCPHPHCLHT